MRAKALAPLIQRVEELTQHTDELMQRVDVLQQNVSSITQSVNQLSQRIEDLYSLTVQRSTQRPYYALGSGLGLTTLDSGHYFFVNTNDTTMTPWLILGGHWELDVTPVIMDLIRPEMRVADVGANMGYFTVKIASRLGVDGFIHAFEPNPEVSFICWDNLRINGFERKGKVYQLALGAENDEVELCVPNGHIGNANIIGVRRGYSDYPVDVATHPVQVTRLDDVLEEHEVLDLIKIDAEGAEPLVLNGARSILARSPDCIIVLELNLDRWRLLEAFDTLKGYVGNRNFFAIFRDATVKQIDFDDIPAFLEGCPLTENYFVIARPECLAAIKGRLR